MKRYFIIFLTIILIVSSFHAVGTEKTQKEYKEQLKTTVSFSHLSIQETQDYAQLQFVGTNEYISEPGFPRLPMYTNVYCIPGKAKDIKIQITCENPMQQSIEKKILPEPQTIYRNINPQQKLDYVENQKIYTTNAFYPTNTFDYSIRCGLDTTGNPVTFVTINVYPVQYNPVKNYIKTYDSAELIIDYNMQTNQVITSSSDSFELVIIAPELFTDSLQSFVDHKIDMGVSTILKTTESIFSEYSGRDEPEKIKYFIKDAKENWNSKYVLLMGGLTSYLYAQDKEGRSYGNKAWHVPVRYANIREGSETSAISDLYYADLYRYNEEIGEWEFEDWDRNGDGVFAKWGFFGTDKDELDLAPDIYVGRLPCRNTAELTIVCNKIINYESSSPDDKPWFRKMIGVSGKNFDMWKGQPDGEYLVDRAIENMSSRIEDVVRIYASNVQSGEGPIPVSEDIVEEFSKGAGFIDFEGHGNPVVWDTIHADGRYEDHDWVGGIRIPDFLKLSNKDKLPIVMVGGCHNGLFNVTMLRILLMRNKDPVPYWTTTPTPVCFCWGMVIKPAGGAIASIGATGLGPASGADPISLQGEIDNYFFSVVGQDLVEKLGEGHSGAITKYVTENDMRQRETFTATITQLFGDPSLQLGGYS